MTYVRNFYPQNCILDMHTKLNKKRVFNDLALSCVTATQLQAISISNVIGVHFKLYPPISSLSSRMRNPVSS